MPLSEADIQTAQQQLERLLESKFFARSPQLSQLLRFLIEQHLAGRGRELKESVIGVEVFGRNPDYNPKFDPIVRTEARRLRQRLSDYYANEGKADPLVIEVPKGGYLPVMHPIVLVEVSAERKPATAWFWRGIAIGSIALALAALVWMRFGPRKSPSSSNPESRQLYLRGREFEIMPGVRGVEQSIDLFEQALAKDRSFAPAWAGIAAGRQRDRLSTDSIHPSERI